MSIEAVKTMIDSATVPVETAADAVRRLSLLPALDYETLRDKEAQRMGIRVSALDAEVERVRNAAAAPMARAQMFPVVELWPEAVEGQTLLGEILATVQRFIICEPETARAATLWVVFTWLIDVVNVAPLAVITAPEKRCGKSQLLNLLGRLSRCPMVASNITSAAMFRIIEAYQPTLLIDEADTFMRDNEELRGVINSGHTRQSAFVIRTVGDDHEPKPFSTWSSKAISGIGKLPDTIMDRAIILELRRKMSDEKVERLRHAEDGLFERLASQIARWANDNAAAIRSARPYLPESLNDRAQDNWEPLLAIADCVGGDWPMLARHTAVTMAGKEYDTASLSSELLADIRTVLDRRVGDKIGTADLLAELIRDEEAPWATYNRGKPLSPRQLAKKLGEYGIKPSTQRIGGILCKGYLLSDFADAFARYVISPEAAPDLSVTSVTNPILLDASNGYAVTDKNTCYGNKNLSVTPKSLIDNSCYAVTDKNQTFPEYIAEVL